MTASVATIAEPKDRPYTYNDVHPEIIHRWLLVSR